jgi:phosphoglycerate dehydrogenase-like enzyme
MKAIIAIKSLKENKYFHEKANRLFSEITYADQRPKEEDMPKFLSGYDVAIIGAREKINENILKKVINPPKIIGTLSVGLDHIDVGFLKKMGVTIINTPTANVISVSEHVMAFALSLVKRLKEADSAVQNSIGRSGLHDSPTELNGKTFGLIGYGNIAKKIVPLARCFGMKIVATSRTRTSGQDSDVTFYTLQQVLSESEIISINVPLTDSTKNLINDKSLKSLGRKPVIINTSRSEIVDHNAISICLNNGHLSGYAEDSENIPECLKNRTDVLWSPHIAGLSKEASDRLDNELIDRIEKYIVH